MTNLTSTQPGTRVITPAGLHGAIAHPYTNDAGQRVAYVKIDGRDRKGQYLIDELRPEPTPADRNPQHSPFTCLDIACATCHGLEPDATAEPHFPTFAELDAQRRDLALASPRAAFHELAKARIARGQAWNRGGAHRATPEELLAGIGGSSIGTRAALRDARRAIKSGLVIG